MSTRPSLVSLLTIAMGGLILVAGLAGIVFYVSYVVESTTGEADRSGLFWYLPILFSGLGGVAVGVVLFVVGVYALRGSAVCARIARGALVVIPLIVLVLAGLSHMSERAAQREREARIAQNRAVERALADMHQIRRLDVSEQSGSAIALNIATTGGLVGNYELRLKGHTSRGILYRQASRLRLESSMTNIRRSITYRALFARCFDDPESDEFFVCAQDAGTTNTRFQLEAELRLLRAAGDTRMDIGANPEMFTNSSSATFLMDTFTRAYQVQVEDFRLADEQGR